MTDDQIRELERLLGEATQGPWSAETAGTTGKDYLMGDAVVWSYGTRDPDGDVPGFIGNVGPTAVAPVGVSFDHEEADAHLIAFARNALPDLLAERRKLMAVVEAARVLVAECDRHDGKVHWYEPGATDNLRDALHDLDEGGG